MKLRFPFGLRALWKTYWSTKGLCTEKAWVPLQQECSSLPSGAKEEFPGQAQACPRSRRTASLGTMDGRHTQASHSGWQNSGPSAWTEVAAHQLPLSPEAAHTCFSFTPGAQALFRTPSLKISTYPAPIAWIKPKASPEASQQGTSTHAQTWAMSTYQTFNP